MCLIMTAFAAVITTIVWYAKSPDKQYRLGSLALMYWGATLMWICDGVSSVIGGEGFFDLSLDDALLGLLIVLLGLIGWMVVLLVKDPKGVMAKISGK